jgi:hypothetical protein
MKYHIFIGSTLDDLKNERKEIPRIIMELGHIPVTSEYLDNTDRNYDKMLEKIIEECDYFIAVVAHKYAPKGEKISPLETEYNIAYRKSVPVISLIIDEKARWKATKKEKDPTLVRRLADFKKRLDAGTICESWLNSPELCQKLQGTLIMQMNLEPRRGWVRADQAIEPSVANELSRLSNENAQLKRQVQLESSGEFIIKLQAELKKAMKVLALNKVMLSFYYTDGDNWENSRRFRYLRIFKLLVPELEVGKTIAEISLFLGTVLNPDLDRSVRIDFPIPSNTVKKILADLSTLKLVRCAGENEIWEISEYGKELYSAYRMRQLAKALDKPEK